MAWSARGQMWKLLCWPTQRGKNCDNARRRPKVAPLGDSSLLRRMRAGLPRLAHPTQADGAEVRG